MQSDTLRHTRFVNLAKVLLPLAALVLLSVMFLVSDRVDPTTASLYTDVDVGALAKEERLGAPHYAGVTEDGATLLVQASAAYPDWNGTSGTGAQDVAAKLEGQDGTTADLSARSGRIDPAGGTVLLSDGVAMRTSTGYRVTTDKAEVATDRSRVTMPGPVEAEAPYGRIDAGSAELSRSAADRPFDLVFNGGVKLLYQPGE